MDKPTFDLHFEIGYAQSVMEYVVRLVLGMNSLIFVKRRGMICDAIHDIALEISRCGVFASLVRNPQLSTYPIPASSDPLVSHVCDLHMELGITDHSKYARTAFLMNNVEYRTEEIYYEDCISELAYELNISSTLPYLAVNPHLSVYPIPFKTISVSTMDCGQSKKQSNAPKRLPSDLIDIEYPECINLCTSMDIFGKSKCKNICSWRPEV